MCLQPGLITAECLYRWSYKQTLKADLEDCSMTLASTANEIEYRLATSKDDDDVLTILEEVAPEIPVDLEGPVEQGKIKAVIRERHQSKKSWVAVDQDQGIVGFVLARPDVYEGKSAIYIDYVGVSASFRRRGIFSALMGKLKANGVKVHAKVLYGNLSSMVDVFVADGFAKIEPLPDAKETKVVWSPPNKVAQVGTGGGIDSSG
jgi:ribosomal protein S18 acetylase RimI-like enzyme